MGRSLTFTLDDIYYPKPLPSSYDLSKLKVGENIKICYEKEKIDEAPVLQRSVSCYRKNPSYISVNSIYIVESIDYQENLKNNIRAIVVRDINISEEQHIYSWCITTDGYIREIEHFGILYKINNVIIF
jgi:hypothetical protein